MTNEQITPGPWRIGQERPNDWGKNHLIHGAGTNFYPDGFIIATAIHSNFFDDKGAEGKANAALIAAAPDLLTALTALIGKGINQKDWQNAHAAIAKAKGDTS